MFHNLFAEMHDTIEQINQDLQTATDIDQELSLLEKYLSIKELSEDLAYELKKLNFTLHKFEQQHGLEEMSLQNSEETENSPSEGEVVIELDEGDFFSFQKGIGFYDLLMYDQAIIHLEKIINKYPDFNLARIYTAMTYFKKGLYNETLRELEILFKMSDDPDLISLGQNLMGMIKSHKEDYEEAIAYFNHAIKLKPRWNEPKFNLALVYLKLNKTEDSIALLEELYELDPKDWEVLFYLGKAYQKLNNLNMAAEFYKQTFAITKQPLIIKQIASHFEIRRNFAQAIHWYNKWVNLEPNNVPAHIGIAKNTWLSGDKETAFAMIKKALALDSNNHEAKLLYAWMLTDNNDSRALDIVNQLLEKDDFSQKNGYLVANLARLSYLNHDFAKANQFCERMLQSSSKSLQKLGHIVQGLIHLDQQKPSDALYHLEKSTDELNSFPYIDFYLGYSHYLLGSLDKAKEHWNKLVK